LNGFDHAGSKEPPTSAHARGGTLGAQPGFRVPCEGIGVHRVTGNRALPMSLRECTAHYDPVTPSRSRSARTAEGRDSANLRAARSTATAPQLNIHRFRAADRAVRISVRRTVV